MRAIGDLIEWAGPDGTVITMSDHGFGPKDKAVNVNLALHEWGMLGIAGAGSLGSPPSLAEGRRRRVKKVAAQGAVEEGQGSGALDDRLVQDEGVLGAQSSAGDLHQSRGPGATRDRCRQRLRGGARRDHRTLQRARDPDDGKPVLDRMYKREDVIHGPVAERAPDLFPVCRDYSYELSDGLFSPSVLTDYRDLPRGFHHMDGVFGIAGPEAAKQAGRTRIAVRHRPHRALPRRTQASPRWTAGCWTSS